MTEASASVCLLLAVRFSEQINPADIYPSISPRQMEDFVPL